MPSPPSSRRPPSAAATVRGAQAEPLDALVRQGGARCARARGGLARWKLAWGAGLVLGALSGCSGRERAPYAEDEGGTARDIPYERLPPTTDAFEEDTCGSQLSGYASQCGTLRVPEAPGSERALRLAVRRVFSNSDEVAADPIVYLNGGPGGSTLDAVGFLVDTFEPLLEGRDLIFVDQRGTGRSRPGLFCTEEGTELDAMLDQCFERLSRTIDLSTVNSAQNARDHDALRQALGYERWNLLGVSYGTRLGLTILRDFPEGVRSLVLDSVVPLQIDLLAGFGVNGQASFERTFAACEADAECHEAFPEPMQRLRETVRRLNETPSVTPPLTGDELVDLLFVVSYSPSGVALLPYLIETISNGDFEVYERLTKSLSSGGNAFGMHLSVQCSEEMAFTSAERIAERDEQVFEELRSALSGEPYVGYCEHWPVPPAAPRENQAVLSSAPSLVLSGEFDPITPPRYAELVHADLAGSRYFEVLGEAHGASSGACGASLIAAFLDDPSAPLDASCTDESPPPDFRVTTALRAGAEATRRLRFVRGRPSDDQLREIARDVQRRRG